MYLCWSTSLSIWTDHKVKETMGWIVEILTCNPKFICADSVAPVGTQPCKKVLGKLWCATKLIWKCKATGNQFLIAFLSVAFLKCPFFSMEKFHYWSTWKFSNIITIEMSLQDAGGPLCSSFPSQNLPCSMPSGCLALDKWFFSGSIPKDTGQALGPTPCMWLLELIERCSLLSHADQYESRKAQWEWSLEAFVQGVGMQIKLVLALCTHETGLIWIVHGGKPKCEEKARHGAKHAIDRFSSSP